MTTSWSDNARRRKLSRQAPAASDVPKASAARKDTRKWCKGVEGRLHQPKCFEKRPGWYELCCEKCGKELDYWIDYSKTRWLGLRRNPRPNWVSE